MPKFVYDLTKKLKFQSPFKASFECFLKTNGICYCVHQLRRLAIKSSVV